eukprot:COSAG02_NODE_98_length_37150_cov_39.614207_17_plen_104_part_00
MRDRAGLQSGQLRRLNNSKSTAVGGETLRNRKITTVVQDGWMIAERSRLMIRQNCMDGRMDGLAARRRVLVRRDRRAPRARSGTRAGGGRTAMPASVGGTQGW